MIKKFLTRFVLFLSPFFFLIGLELFVFPIDAFTFRVWEAFSNKNQSWLPGPFYPSRSMHRVEVGDLGHHTPYAVPKEVEWIVDEYGYRHRNLVGGSPEVVVIGDSNIVGSSLTQEDMLTDVLQRKLNIHVYPFSPRGVKEFFREKRFLRDPPKIVICAFIERGIPNLPRLKKKSPYRHVHAKILQEGLVLLDRFEKANMYHFLQSRLKGLFPGSGNTNFHVDGEFFLQGAAANEPIPDEQVEEAVRILKANQQGFAEAGMEFLFVPIPNKETIYFEYFDNPKPDFLQRLHKKLEANGIPSVNTQVAFDRAHQKGVRLYQSDDTHWSPEGVRITADLIASALKGKI